MSQDSQIAQTDRGLTKRELPRLRFQYGKDERLAFLGHLEVIGTIDRFPFYDEAKKSYVVIATSERAQYANVILQKGVVYENEKID